MTRRRKNFIKLPSKDPGEQSGEDGLNSKEKQQAAPSGAVRVYGATYMIPELMDFAQGSSGNNVQNTAPDRENRQVRSANIPMTERKTYSRGAGPSSMPHPSIRVSKI